MEHMMLKHLAKTADRLSWAGAIIAGVIGFSMHNPWVWLAIFFWFLAFQSASILFLREVDELAKGKDSVDQQSSED